MITFLHPIWLVLAIPLLAAWWIWKPSSRFLQVARLAIIWLVLAALSGLAVNLPSRAGTLVVVADRSLSMPGNSEEVEREAIGLVQGAMSADDRLAVVSFGQQAVIERSPQTGAFAGFTNRVEPDASNLAEALEKALALIPPNSPGKILILSDGRWTGKDPSSAAAKAAMRGVVIDYRSLQRSMADDLAIAQIDAPVTVSPGEAFMITAWVKSPVQREIEFELRRGSRTLAAGKTTVTSGVNRLTFRDIADESGAQSYLLRIKADGQDPVPENNTAKVLVGVQGPRPLLVVTSSQNSGLARLLVGGGLKVKTALPQDCEWSLDSLAQYSGVLLENVPAALIGERGMESLVTWITETGAGMMITGGRNSYGSGGYFKSPLEAVMPVSMELRQEHRKLSLALVIAMDRSGSMAVPVRGGQTKMDLANLAAVQVLDLLSPGDEFGVIAVDSASHVIADLNPVAINAKLRKQILQIDSGGGGIFIYEALTSAAEMLLRAKAGTRHIILFADAADSEEPGKYRELLEKCEDAGITVSVIGLGKPTDVDADLLRDIAKRGKGESYFTDSAEELPRLFAQDTIIVARSAFLEEPTPIQFTGGMVTLTGKQFTSAPEAQGTQTAPPAPSQIAHVAQIAQIAQIGGYNLTYLRPKANLAAVTVDGYQAPVVAAWQAGSGRVLCYTGEADGNFTGAIANWKNVGDLFTSLARWTTGDANNLPGQMLVTQEVKNGIGVIQLQLDPERDRTPAQEGSAITSISELPQVTTLYGVAGARPRAEKSEMRWVSADQLEISIPLRGPETALSTVEVPGFGRVTLSPVALPYSPEFKPAVNEEGQATLAQLAKVAGGRERVELSGVWKDLPRKLRLIELAPWLLMLATLCLLVEVLERQTGLVTAGLFPVLQRVRRVRERYIGTLGVESKPQSPQLPAKVPVKIPAGIAGGTSTDSETAPTVSAPSAEPSADPDQEMEPSAILGALKQAQRRARERRGEGEGSLPVEGTGTRRRGDE